MGNNSEHSRFIDSSEVKAADETHRKRLLKVIASYDSVVVNQKSSQFVDWQDARTLASEVKRYVLDNLPELLETFELNAKRNGMQVLWARDVDEAHRLIEQIIARHHVKKVVKSKSMTSEELELNEFLEHRGIETLESDLGELIVQLNNEKPYHIVTPAMHKSKEEISEIFQRTLGCEPTTDAEELTDIARRHLREVYITADLGISGANFLLADDGAILILENEGNARLSTACPKVHLSIAGIEKLLPSISDLELFLPLLSTSGTGQQMTAYNSIIRGPRSRDEIDGPEVMYLLLLDNGRSNIYSKPEVRDALSCIRCGACLNACPVYKTVGGHTYNTPYSGPIGAVITPHLKGMRDWGHLAFASSLCGACTDVCPVKIPLHHMLLTNRQEANSTAPSYFWQTALRFWALTMKSRFVVDCGGRAARIGLQILEAVAPRLAAKFPKPAPKSFSSWWRQHGK
ncbi:MAG: LutB/LldF family L-lactate oxidation iron-sulfur protein [Pseudomonadota bacterium]|jgi:L-lactate dehydrogenase complex protein LldF